MVHINFFTVKQVKEKGGRYDLKSKVVRSPKDVNDFLQTVFELDTLPYEKFGILSLNTKNAVVGVHVVSTGSLNASIVHPREVFYRAILNNAASIILFHNHPSGDATPSPEDQNVTSRLQDAGKIMGIEVLDHIVTGDNRTYTSLKEMGYMS